MRLGLTLALTLVCAAALAVVAWNVFGDHGEVPAVPTTPPADPPARIPEPEPAPPILPPPGPPLPPDIATAKALVEMGEPDSAVEELSEVLAAEPGNLEARRLRAKLMNELGFSRRAERDLRFVVASEEATVEDIDALAETVLTTKPAESRRLLERSVRESAGRARPHALLARIHLRAGRRGEAQDEVNRALFIDPYEPLAVSLNARLSR